ncbi:MAG: hypothetical protein PVF96_01595 [Candidatus Bathyarchaeota archaeon]|jgi:hypothetical protein
MCLTLGRISKGVTCSVSGCGEKAARSISASKVRTAGLKIAMDDRRSYLCKNHYKEYKRKSRKEKKIEQWRYQTE